MLLVRASAASRLTPPAGIHAARPDTGAPKTDAASPFALLVNTAAAPAAKAAERKGPDNKSDNRPEPDTDQSAAAQPSSQNQATTQTKDANPQSAATDGNSQGIAPSAGDNRKEEVAQADRDAASAFDPSQAIDPATLPAAAPLPPVSQTMQAAPDDAAPDATLIDEHAVALWPQSIRPNVSQAAPQAAKPVKTDKDLRKEATDTGALPDAAALLAAGTPSVDQQPVAALAAAAPAPTVPAPQAETPAEPMTPAIQPAVQPAAPQAPALPQVPSAAEQGAEQAPEQAAGQQIAGQQAAAQPSAAQDSDPTAGPDLKPATPATAPSAPVQAAASARAPKITAPAQDRTETDKIALAPQPVAAKKQPQPAPAQPGVEAETSKPAKASGPTQQDSDAAVKSADRASADVDKVQQPDAPKPAPPAPDTAIKAAANAITPPASAPSAAPQAPGLGNTQHIQVTAQPHEAAPNLPALAVAIAGKSQSGAKQFDIRLDPPELGRVDVRLSIDASGKASAHLSADQPQTLTLLQKDAHVLTRALRDAGLDMSQDGLNFSLRQQQDNGAGAQSNQSGGRSGRGFALTATASLEATATSAAYSGAADGHLDIRV